MLSQLSYAPIGCREQMRLTTSYILPHLIAFVKYFLQISQDFFLVHPHCTQPWTGERQYYTRSRPVCQGDLASFFDGILWNSTLVRPVRIMHSAQNSHSTIVKFVT